MGKLKKYTRLFRNNASVGIDVFIKPDGNHLYSLCVTQKVKSKLTIKRSYGRLTDITELIQHIEEGTPVYISINGKGVFHKKIEFASEADESYYLSAVLPGDTSHNDFYVQLSPVYGNFLYVSVARKNVIDHIIAKLAEERIEVLSCSLGPFIIHHLLDGIESSNGNFYQLSLPNHSLSISNKQIIEYHVVKETSDNPADKMFIYEQETSSEDLIPFSLSLQHYINNFSISVSDTAIKNRQTTFKQKRIFELRFPALIIILSISILGLLLMKVNLNNKKQKLLTTLSSYDKDLQQYDTLLNIYKAKRDFIERNDMSRISRSSFYIDRLLAGIPDNIQLTEVNYCPAKRNLSNDSLIKYNSGSFIVSGNCGQSALLNEWMKDIKTKDFIQEIRLENYKQDKQNSRGEFLFIASIK